MQYRLFIIVIIIVVEYWRQISSRRTCPECVCVFFPPSVACGFTSFAPNRGYPRAPSYTAQ